MPSDRSDAGIRLLGYSAARRRNLLADDAQRPRRVAPRPSGLLPRTLPAVVHSRRVFPTQRGDYRPLINHLTDSELAREAIASLRDHDAPTEDAELAPELLDLDSGPAPRSVGRVASGRHRNGRSLNTRTGWVTAAAAVMIAAATGLTAWAVNTPADVPATQQVPVDLPASTAKQASTASSVPTRSTTPPNSSSEPATPAVAIPAGVVPPTMDASIPTAGAPAVVSTLGPDDPGFGWPSSAFGTGGR